MLPETKCGSDSSDNGANLEKTFLTAELQPLAQDIRNGNLEVVGSPKGFDPTNIALDARNYVQISYASARICVLNPNLFENLHMPKDNLADGLQTFIGSCCPANATQECQAGTTPSMVIRLQRSECLVAGTLKYLDFLESFISNDAFQLVFITSLDGVAAFANIEVKEPSSLARVAIRTGRSFEDILDRAGTDTSLFSEQPLVDARHIAQTAVHEGIDAATREAEADGELVIEAGLDAAAAGLEDPDPFDV
ncbi:uncharacterized protein Z519_09751 [Cladophialophora bantiana CBS 173.52]|uniref:Uncharacterized protein n=1 Tax=Cladophialophora bantiana (strain ATCC 10958 / CBS 173.52 / CDC B-1940 / NIH 8579) TaxID=1442370 RepID=A0A0D2HFP9_CLAB1|nr:uncharacterized protein Z519_09751 [Cladophialophora bantiana CBS 173.52]KIW89595.1 hypothetical protein Z519_09751 [Cladophialophora bantiana CBS 173.52]